MAKLQNANLSVLECQGPQNRNVARKSDQGRKPNKFCSCDHKAPKLRNIRSTMYNHELAEEVSALGLSGDGIVDWALSELLDHHRGKLLPSDFDMVNRDSDDPKQVERFDNLWSAGDQRRFINRYKDRAKRDFKYRLKMSSVDSVAMLHFALEIHNCRSSGKCSRVADRA